MSTQSKAQIEKILERASKFKYQGLYWYIEAKLPSNIYSAAAYPGRYIPVIRVGPDIAESRGLAIWLLMMIQSIAAPTLEFSIALTSEDLIAKLKKWWVWGDPLCFDAVCYVCGQVVRTHYTIAIDGFMCSDCAMSYEKGSYDDITGEMSLLRYREWRICRD